jgi:hypothetical protein
MDAVNGLAAKIAKLQPAFLSVKKCSVNRHHDNRGIHSAPLAGAETAALLHLPEPVRLQVGVSSGQRTRQDDPGLPRVTA